MGPMMPREPAPGQIQELCLGIDPGYASCGLSYVDVRTRRLVDYLVIETPAAQDLTVRLPLVYRQLALAIRRRGVVAVGYEDQFRVGKAKQAQGQTNFNPILLGRVQGYIESLVWELGIPLYALDPGDVKVATLGPGHRRATKNQVREGVYRITGKRMNEHAADATAASFATVRRYSVEIRIRRRPQTQM